ncbi:AfsR/SARP family transcriptional regulator [Paractinoplanes brasiliensis]|uniref:DNA-binding SARP family transcriptional activator n=1 Tax=Paractinoplanes brasiliensis TaxID=52695 RepID=A0A4R6JQY9_9ACTN|nr:BTAD domain-containing putative transcriptional regulator [Actinoplanes brasiliensis]TDO37055.1 DNA-binding SARP family transcriptional activator [Actinoplanes brasiliensis]GID32251.1 SARP family transcriptional regulator [Actinoplanes brasiliensis]
MSLTDDEEPATRFGVLGPVRVWRRGAELDLGARQQRLILALLLANAGRPVGIGDIVEVLWDKEPPPSALNVVHRYVGALRRLFEPGLPSRSPGRWLLGDATGYRMRVDPGHLDLLRFRELAEQARSAERAGRPAEAMTAYEQALGLWRGPCGGASELVSYSHAAFSAVDHECADLAREAASLALRLERVRSILPVLRRVAEHRQWDEALQARLLLVLSADGQQAEAIALFRNVRRRLADELGVDPGEELREAYQVVLGQNSYDSAEPAHPRHTQTHRSPAIAAVLPAQLPADLPHFTGRDEAQHRTVGLVNGHVLTQASMPVLAIDGIPGIGKTTLAIHLAHQLADAYPDGQLYVDLQGFDPEQSMLHPAEALRGFLNALGVPDAEIPASDHARSGLYRSVLAGRRILVVLDNAHSVEQVRPLLPGSSGCLVLVTSRKRLTGLATAHGAFLMTLDVLPIEDARDFLAARIGVDRTEREPVAVDEIIERCGRLPLALAVVAARALVHPDFGLTDIARELRDAQGSLDGFSGDDMDNDLRAIFSWSYRMLSERAATMFRLLSLHPGPDMTVPALASLAGIPPAEARLLAGELVRTGLLTEHKMGRFTTHDLIRAYAQELIGPEDSESRAEASRRMFHHYRLTSYHADRLLRPALALDPPPAVADVCVTPMGTAADAEAWFNADRHVLKAVVQRQIEEGRATSAWPLVVSMQMFLQRDGWWHDWAAATQAGLDATVAAGDDLGRAHMSRGLAGAWHVLGRHEDAARLLRHSLGLFERLGRCPEQALVHRNLGQVSSALGDHGGAVAHYERALSLFEELRDPVGQVAVLCLLADAHSGLGRSDVSMELGNRALTMAEALGEPASQALCCQTVARSFAAKGDHVSARAAWARAAEIFQRIGWRMNTVDCLLELGDTALALDDLDAARAAWRQALELIGQQSVPERAAAESRLAGLDPPRAVRTHSGGLRAVSAGCGQRRAKS